MPLRHGKDSLHFRRVPPSNVKRRPDAVRLSRYLLSGHARGGVKEVHVRWNDLARTSLARATLRISSHRCCGASSET
jgi:hypothetical protein